MKWETQIYCLWNADILILQKNKLVLHLPVHQFERKLCAKANSADSRYTAPIILPKFFRVIQVSNIWDKMGLNTWKPVFGGLQTTQAQTSLRIHAVWSVPLLLAFWEVSYVNLLMMKFQYSSWSL